MAFLTWGEAPAARSNDLSRIWAASGGRLNLPLILGVALSLGAWAGALRLAAAWLG